MRVILLKNIMLYFSLLLLSTNLVYSSTTSDSLIKVLEKEIILSKSYLIVKERKIQNLKNLLSEKGIDLNMQYFITNKIIREYQYYSFDKALFYSEKNLQIALQLKDDYKIAESKLILARLLVDSSRYKESLDLMKELKVSNLKDELKNDFYFIHKEAYSGLSFYTMVKNNKEDYDRLYLQYKDSLFARLGPSSDENRSLLEKKFRDNRELKKALEINSKRLQLAKMGTRHYSLVTFERSLLYQLMNNFESQKTYLILSAISDIRANIRDNASLTELSMILYRENDIDRAHNFILFSMEDAKFYNSPIRFVNISNILPTIVNGYENRNLEQKKSLQGFVIMVSVLSLILLFVIGFIFKQNKKLTKATANLNKVNEELNWLNLELNNKNEDLSKLYDLLSESNDIKEHYIGSFLNLYSEYIDKLDVYRKLVTKHLVTNKTKELLELTKSKQVIDSEIKVFYDNFDESFLQIYPNFITQFNGLLKKDHQILLKSSDELLNSELRIYALIRLGITNSAKIAKILRYSINTIYNYRVKIKNNAIDREIFEDSVKKIK
jgi:competence protein ComGC